MFKHDRKKRTVVEEMGPMRKELKVIRRNTCSSFVKNEDGYWDGI